jgi:hypothetical protein
MRSILRIHNDLIDAYGLLEDYTITHEVPGSLIACRDRFYNLLAELQQYEYTPMFTKDEVEEIINKSFQTVNH